MMKTDYTYCLNEDTCIHRRGCKRWVGNYTNDEVKELANSYEDEYLDDAYCMDSIPLSYDSLDRIRLSNERELGKYK